MSTPGHKLYWCRHTSGDGTWRAGAGRRTQEGPPGEELAALRRGLGRSPWSVPGMWPLYAETDPPDNRKQGYTRAQAAEHAALTLFGVHQQAQAHPMHRVGVGLGTAALALRQHGGAPGPDDPPSPVDRRFTAAATATDLIELVLHLRGLVTQLRGIGQPLDYTQLYEELRLWQDPHRAAQVRRRWGMQYFTRVKEPAVSPDGATGPNDKTQTEEPQ